MKIKNIVIPTGQFLFVVFMIGGFTVGNVLVILTWSELETFSTELMEDEEFSKNLSPACVENVVGLGWKSVNSTVHEEYYFFYGDYFLFGDSSIEESGCNIMDLAENEPLKDLYRHVPQWYVNSDIIWTFISIMYGTMFTFWFLIIGYWPYKTNNNKYSKYKRIFSQKENKYGEILLWSIIACSWIAIIIIRYS